MKTLVSMLICAMAAFPSWAGVDRVDILRATIEAVAPGARFSGDPKAYSFRGTLSGTTETEAEGWTIRRSDGAVFRLRAEGGGFKVLDGSGRLLYSVQTTGEDVVFSPATQSAPAVRARRSGANPATGYTGWTCDGQLRATMPSEPDKSKVAPSSRQIGVGEMYDRMYESRKAGRPR